MVSFFSFLKAAVKDVLLTDQSTWDTWFQNIKESVENYLWEYFDLNDTAKFVKPIQPVKPVPKWATQNSISDLIGTKHSKICFHL